MPIHRNYHRKKWDELKLKSEKWIGLDTYGEAFISINWNDDYKKYYLHHNCYITISSSQKLKLAQNRARKRAAEADCMHNESGAHCSIEFPDYPQLKKHLRSSVLGPLHNKSMCVWCRKGTDKKNSNKKNSKLSRISTISA